MVRRYTVDNIAKFADEIFDNLNLAAQSYPFYNVVEVDETHYNLELAVAGFKDEELEVTLDHKNVLKIHGERVRSKDRILVHQGISQKDFTRHFTLSRDAVVNAVGLMDGILTIQLERKVPKEEEPKKFNIVTNEKRAYNPEVLKG